MRLRLGSVEHDLTTRPLVMGMLDPSPASLGTGAGSADLVTRAGDLVGEGADLLDVGGVWIADGDVSEEEELERVVPVVEALRARFDVALSVDTWRARVLAECCAAGAAIGNDLSGFADDEYLPTAVRAGAAVVATHVRLRPRPADARPLDVAAEVRAFLAARVAQAAAAGVDPDSVIVDAGLDHGKTPGQSLALLRESATLADIGPPLLLSAAGRRFPGVVLDLDVDERRVATLAAAALGVSRGCRIVRASDVRGARRVADVLEAVLTARLAQVEQADLEESRG